MSGDGGSRELTQAQTLIWAGQQLHPGDPLYNMVHAFRIAGPVDRAVFERAFDALVAGTDSLRTTFTANDGVPQRNVAAEAPAPLRHVDLSAERDVDAAYRSWAEREAAGLLDLGNSLYRATLVELGEADWVFFIVQHHLITDGWATAIVYRRLEALYRTFASGGAPEDEYPSFEHYADFEQRFRASDEFAEAEAFWAAKAGEPLPTLSFYGETPQPGGLTRTDRVTQHLGRDRSAQIAEIAERAGGGMLGGVSEFTVFATVLFAWLSRVTGERELAILAPAHNRPSARFKRTSGLFMEVLPLHVSLTEDETFRSLLDKVGSAATDLLLYAQPGTSSATHNRAYSVLMNYINASFSPFNDWDMRSEWVHSGHGDSDHSLRLQIHDFDATGDVELHFDLSAEVFDGPAKDRIVRHYLAVVDALLADLDARISSIDLLTDEEREAAAAFRGPTLPVPYASLLEPFADCVASHPDAAAIRLGDEVTTYVALDALSDTVGRAIQAATDAAHPRVAVYLPRSSHLIASILGTFKAGGSYVPVDTGYPPDRIGFLIADSGADVILTDVDLASTLADTDTAVVTLPLDDLPAGEQDPLPGAGETAYVMYTSGSTGLPKGVSVSHASLIDYVWWARQTHGGDDPVSFPLYSSIGFDLTVTSLFVPLVSGGTIVVYPEPEHGADLSIVDVFADDAVDVVKLTPSHLALLDPAALRTERIRSLILGGEDLKVTLAAAVHRASAGRLAVYNEYGPTEATVGCMLHRYDPGTDIQRSVPIGTPAPNTAIYVLDEFRMPVPVGVVGEMWIAGSGVATGYHDRPSLTAERFHSDPHDPSQRMYRSGDLARWTAPGVIEFLGRGDDQVKVKGHRIELGEVAAAIAGIDGVTNVFVDVVETETARVGSAVAAEQCLRCGLAAEHPDAQLDGEQICKPCRFHEQYEATAASYFGTMDDFRAIFDGHTTGGPEPDCVMLLSGGKDSTYALYQLVENGLTPLVFSLDNGFIAEGAKANIQRAVDDLGLELVWGSTPAMNDIFADSLGTFSNVCQGCFKTIYTLATTLAHERGLKFIVTGLSRGQMYETRLADLFRIGITDPDAVDAAVIEARKAYHQVDDAVKRLMDTTVFEDGSVFDEIRLVDFYRYTDVGLDELYRFLDEKAPWVRPKDTGRSTNCLINNTGIFIHKRERGFHNYALPYSWDVRLGHKTKPAALAELDDEIDVSQVRDILDQVGYDVEADSSDELRTVEARLVAYYVADESLTSGEVRRGIAETLPDHAVPTYLIPVDALPLTINGKVDKKALPDPRDVVMSGETYVAPQTDLQRQLADVWQSVLGVETIGIHDPFIEIGGDSILSIQVVAKAKANGIQLTARQVFDHPTIAQLARVVTVGDMIESPLPEPIAAGFTPGAFPEAGLSQDELDALLGEFGEPDGS